MTFITKIFSAPLPLVEQRAVLFTPPPLSLERVHVYCNAENKPCTFQSVESRVKRCDVRIKELKNCNQKKKNTQKKEGIQWKTRDMSRTQEASAFEVKRGRLGSECVRREMVSSIGSWEN